METRIGDFIYVHPFMRYGGVLHIPQHIVNKIGGMELIELFKNTHNGSLPMSFQREDFGFRIEFPHKTTIEQIKKFIELIAVIMNAPEGYEKLSTGDDATLGNYRKLALLFFDENSKAIKFLDAKIAQNGENEKVIVSEAQMTALLFKIDKGE